MKNIPDKSVDMVLADVPYGTTSCKWDVIIPFVPMWIELKRITKDNGAICLFGSEPFSSHLRLSNLKMFKYDWVWEKNQPTGMATSNTMPMKYHETISIFYRKSCLYVKQPQAREWRSEIPANYIRRAHPDNHGLNKEIGEFKQYDTANKNPKSIIKIKSVNNAHGKLHPTQKPVALLEYLIKTYTLENETVLDFTMGSGSTGVACKNLNRKFIGIEKDDNYYQIAKNRIDSHIITR